MIITKKESFNGQPLYILSRTADYTKDAINGYYLPYLQQFVEATERGDYFAVFDLSVKGLSGNDKTPVLYSKDIFTAWKESEKQQEYTDVKGLARVRIITAKELKNLKRALKDKLTCLD